MTKLIQLSAGDATIANVMGVYISMISVIVSLYVLGMAAGQRIGCPLSDQKGRQFIQAIGGMVVVKSLLNCFH